MILLTKKVLSSKPFSFEELDSILLFDSAIMN